MPFVKFTLRRILRGRRLVFTSASARVFAVGAQVNGEALRRRSPMQNREKLPMPLFRIPTSLTGDDFV